VTSSAADTTAATASTRPQSAPTEVFVDETQLCLSSTSRIYPKRAVNNSNKFKFIINSDDDSEMAQSITIEKCDRPGHSCRLSDGLMFSDFGLQTVCRQKYVTRRMLVVGDSGRLEVDTFQFPSACNCFQVSSTTFGEYSIANNRKLKGVFLAGGKNPATPQSQHGNQHEEDEPEHDEVQGEKDDAHVDQANNCTTSSTTPFPDAESEDI